MLPRFFIISCRCVSLGFCSASRYSEVSYQFVAFSSTYYTPVHVSHGLTSCQLAVIFMSSLYDCFWVFFAWHCRVAYISIIKLLSNVKGQKEKLLNSILFKAKVDHPLIRRKCVQYPVVLTYFVRNKIKKQMRNCQGYKNVLTSISSQQFNLFHLYK